MDVRLQPVGLSEKAALKAVMDPYLVAHADRVDPDRVHGDPTDYAYFDRYWLEPERRPYWIVADGARAGFMLVNAHSPSGLGCDHGVAEFHVDPAKRRGGIGLAALKAACADHPGAWELQVYKANPEGMGFWPRAVAACAVGAPETVNLGPSIAFRFRTG